MPYTPPKYESNLDSRTALNEHLELRTQDCDKIARLLIRHGANVNVASYPCHDDGQSAGRYFKLEHSPVSYWPRVVKSGDVDWA